MSILSAAAAPDPGAPPSASASAEDRVLSVVLTRRSRDRQGDLVEPAGLDFAAFLANPVVLWAHDLARPPVGRVRRLEQTREAVVADVEFADTPLGRELHALYAEGFLNAWSLGFIPRRRRPLPADAPLPPPPDPGVPARSLVVPPRARTGMDRAGGPAPDVPALGSGPSGASPASAPVALPADGGEGGAARTTGRTSTAVWVSRAWTSGVVDDGFDVPASGAARGGGHHILAAEVVEVSAVPVPAHPQALTLASVRHPALRKALAGWVTAPGAGGADTAEATGGASSPEVVVSFRPAGRADSAAMAPPSPPADAPAAPRWRISAKQLAELGEALLDRLAPTVSRQVWRRAGGSLD